MTTNQTIDGVPRELLLDIEYWLKHMEAEKGVEGRCMALKELHALLDAPASIESLVGRNGGGMVWHECAVCHAKGSYHPDVKWCICGRPFDVPAAQPQGEPVARVEIGADRNAALTITDENWLRSLKDRGAHQIVPLYAEQPAPVAVVPDRDSLRDIIAQAIGGDTYDCVRVWSAWGVGTMSEDDFVPVVEQEERLYEIADACLNELKRLNTKE